MKKTIMITGATSGIGEACATLFANNNFNLILCGRNVEKLATLKQELSKHTEVTTLCFDVSNWQDVEKQIASLGARTIDLLLNNAGNAHGLDAFDTGLLDDFEKMINYNVMGLIYVTKATLPLIKRSKVPHIINIGSVAAKYTYPNGTVYCASKAAVDKLSEGMRMDFNPQGIKVSAIHPGLVQTDFSKVRFKGDTQRADKVYQGYTPLSAYDIADLVLYMATRPHHVNLADIVIMPNDQASGTIVNKKL